MKNISRLLLISFLSWLILFIIGFILFPLKAHNYPLFETGMTIGIACIGVAASAAWLLKVGEPYVSNSVLLGISLMTVNLLIDFVFFLSKSPMQMPFIDYMKDIGLTYLTFPVISIGFGLIIYNLTKQKK